MVFRHARWKSLTLRPKNATLPPKTQRHYPGNSTLPGENATLPSEKATLQHRGGALSRESATVHKASHSPRGCRPARQNEQLVCPDLQHVGDRSRVFFRCTHIPADRTEPESSPASEVHPRTSVTILREVVASPAATKPSRRLHQYLGTVPAQPTLFRRA